MLRILRILWIKQLWYEQMKPGITTFVLGGYLHHLNVTNVMNVTVKIERKISY
jgi:hypothetical protein